MDDLLVAEVGHAVSYIGGHLKDLAQRGHRQVTITVVLVVRPGGWGTVNTGVRFGDGNNGRVGWTLE